MMFMNAWEIDEFVERYRNHLVLSQATRFLRDFRDEVDAHSDGWAYWPLPCRAAKGLMELIQSPETATEEKFRKSLAPIRSFYTRRGLKAGMAMPVIGGHVGREVQP